jgi:tRNA threonylcarbamoyl adenosine modification protein (Sua5/YciO/YrdC/YwlC family)
MCVCRGTYQVTPLTAETVVAKEENYQAIINRAIEVIKAGGLIVCPTDTSYGLACDSSNQAAIEKIINVKRRNKKLGVPLLFSDSAQCDTYHEFSNLERVLTRLFWPGALTLIVTPKGSVPELVTGGRGSIAVRVPDHIIPRGIAQGIKGPIVGTSANRSGEPSPFEITVAKDQLGDDVDLYIDAGPSKSEANSTIVRVEENDVEGASIKVIREGALTMGKLVESLKVDSDALRFWTTRIIFADK